eukprot:GFUD01131263.1.p1 GENE.GFUD01131263.1~~GFUD01131263.1.p1  ORF type:complete len:403 (-),score=135.46 GFUD01131263.1:46-1254(-)
MSAQKNSYQWDHTENAYPFFHTFVTKNLPQNKDCLHKFFIETPCFVTEKYDGTNIAKDDQGKIYSRRLVIDAGQEKFLKTSLRKVKEADVVEFRDKLIEVAGLEETAIAKCLVYGEFICNGFYDYRTRDILGDWKVFGSTLEMKKGFVETLEKLLKAGFSAAKKTSNQIQLFSNEKFVEVTKHANLDTPEKKGENDSIANVIMKNKDDMKKGFIEGLVLTIHDEELGYKIVKWKGAHELQPAAHEKALKADDLIQDADVHEDLKKAFSCLREVITDTSQNKHVNKKSKEPKTNNEETEISKTNLKRKTEQPQKGKYLSKVDKEIILQGTFHSQKKFDCLEEYVKKGKEYLEEYANNLIKEVRKHLAEEKNEFEDVDEDDNIIAFIRYKVRAIIGSQMASLEI